MKYDAEHLFLFDSDIFDYQGKDGKTYRICLEGIDDLEAIEEAFRIDNDGEPLYPMIFDKITTDNPELIDNCSYVLRLALQNDEGCFEGVGLAIVSEDWWVLNSFHVNEIVIAQKVQNLGFGTLMMKKIEEDAFVSNKDAITLQCYKDDFEPEELYEARYNFYTSLGFEPHFDYLQQLMIYPLTDELHLRKIPEITK